MKAENNLVVYVPEGPTGYTVSALLVILKIRLQRRLTGQEESCRMLLSRLK
jgi:hypothetical protein